MSEWSLAMFLLYVNQQYNCIISYMKLFMHYQLQNEHCAFCFFAGMNLSILGVNVCFRIILQCAQFVLGIRCSTYTHI